MNPTDATIITGVGLLICGFFIGHGVAVRALTKRFSAYVGGMKKYHMTLHNALVNSAYALVSDRMGEIEFITKLNAVAMEKYQCNFSMIPTGNKEAPANVDANRGEGERKPHQ